MTSLNVRINFGADWPPIDEQLREQGLKLKLDPLERCFLQRDLDEVSRLRIRCVLTAAESAKARKRIFQIIKEHVKPL